MISLSLLYVPGHVNENEDRQIDRLDRQIDRQIDIYIDRYIDIQIDRQIDRNIIEICNIRLNKCICNLKRYFQQKLTKRYFSQGMVIQRFLFSFYEISLAVSAFLLYS